MPSISRRNVRTVRVNLPLLAATVVLAGSSAVAAHFWQQHQVHKNSGELLKLARQNRAEADRLSSDKNDQSSEKRDKALGEATRALYQYLQLQPDDAEARFELAELYDLTAVAPGQRQRALELYGHAAGIAAEPLPIWRRQAELNFQLEQFREAEELSKKILGRQADDSVGLRILARCLYRRARFPAAPATSEVEASIQSALAQSPENIDLAVELADLYRNPPPQADEPFVRQNVNGAARADAVMDRMVDHSTAALDQEVRDEKLRDNVKKRVDAITPQHVCRAYLARSAYRQRYELPGAEDDLKKALETAPEDVDILLAAARSNPAEADEYLAQVCRVAPKDVRGYLALGRLHYSRRETAEAIEVWNQGLERCGQDDIELHLALAQGHLEAGHLSECRAALDRAEKLSAKLMLPAAARRFISFHVALGHSACLSAEGNHREALPHARRATLLLPELDDLERETAEKVRAFTVLGNVCMQLGQPDLAAGAFRKVTRLQSDNAAAWAQSGAALLQSGRTNEALSDYELAVKLAPDSQEILFGLSQTLLQEQLALPEADRDWSRYAESTNDLRRLIDSQSARHADSGAAAPRGVRPEVMLVADVRMALMRNDRSAAMTLLDGAAASTETQPDQRPTLAAFYNALGEVDKAEAQVQMWADAGASAADANAVHAELSIQRGDFAAAQAFLSDALKEASGPTRTNLLYRLARLSLALDDAPTAEQYLAQVEGQPDPAILLELGELAIRKQDWTAVEKQVDRLREIEGEESTQWRWLRSAGLVAQSQGLEFAAAEPLLAEAEEIQKSIIADRPAWPAGVALAGRIMHRKWELQSAVLAATRFSKSEAAVEVAAREKVAQLLSQAIQVYERAVSLGDNSFSTFESLSLLLDANHQPKEANAYLTKLSVLAMTSPRLAQLAMNRQADKGNLEAATRFSEIAAQGNSQNGLARVRLGEFQAVRGNYAEAESAFRRAILEFPADPQGWGALVRLLVQQKRADDARLELENLVVRQEKAKAQKGPVIPEPQYSLLLAEGHRQCRDIDLARKYFDQAEAAAPTNAGVLLQVARFYSNLDPDRAKQILRKLAPQSVSARRELASLMLLTGSSSDWEEAKGLLEEGGLSNAGRSKDKRLLAVLLWKRGGDKNRAEARELIESLVREATTPDPLNLVLLANMLETMGDLPAARQRLEEAVAGPEPQPIYMLLLASFLLQHQATDDATPWLDRLEGEGPPDMARTQLRARWLVQKNRSDEAVALVNQFVDSKLPTLSDPRERVKFLLQGVAIQDGMGFPDHAERLLRKAVESDPLQLPLLVRWLSSKRQHAAAIEACLGSAPTDERPQLDIALAEAAIAAVGNESLSEAQASAIEKRLAAAAARHSTNDGLLFYLGTLRYMQQRQNEALKIFSTIVKRSPDNLPALNNLAVLLSEQPNDKERALLVIDSAIEKNEKAGGGGKTELLDSRGLVLLNSDRPEEAREVLEKVLRESPDNPQYAFHLAWAHYRLGNNQEARTLLVQAWLKNLANVALSPRERQQLNLMETALAAREAAEPEAKPDSSSKDDAPPSGAAN